MDAEAILKLSSVMAALIAAIVSLSLLLAKEFFDRRKAQQRAFRTLYLYCRSLRNALQCEPKPPAHLSLAAVFDQAQEVILSESALATLTDFEDALLAWKRAEALDRQLSSSERQELVGKLNFSMQQLRVTSRC